MPSEVAGAGMTLVAAALTGLVVVLAALTIVWAWSVKLRDASIVDICWGPGFILLVWLYCVLYQAFTPRPLLIAVLVTVWGVRLAVHIACRHGGEDRRYHAMRLVGGHAFWWRSLFIVFWLQAAILWFVALPLLVVARVPGPAGVTATDLVGLLLFALGFACEAIGDYQLERFGAEPTNRGRVLDTGLWRYTRHPNYFGDAVLWWGLYCIAASAPNGWMTAASPLLMTLLLLRVSGVTLLEQSLKLSKPGYASYMARTSAFVPWPPRPFSS
jgi:steroid 5-alpha reductase family enzyme